MMQELIWRKGGSRLSELGDVAGTTGGGGMIPAISESGIDSVVPLSKRIVHGRSTGPAGEDSQANVGKGMTITVPETRVFVEGLMRSTRVPGGYFSSN
jgi:hypothetical protein